MTREPRLGVDIGRVIIDGPAHSRGADTAFFQGDEATMLATPEVPESFATIATLVEWFDGRVWLVSKCGPRVQARTLRWLDGHDFYDRTGVDREHVRFCRERAEKRGHCEDLGLTHFVDDRPEVHDAIRGVVEHQYLFRPHGEDTHMNETPEFVTATGSWPEVATLIASTLGRGHSVDSGPVDTGR